MADKPKPSDAADMLDPGGWPDASETRFRQVAEDCVNALQSLVNNGMTPWDREHKDTFSNGGGNWSGDAAGAAGGKGSTLLSSFVDMQNHLTLAANWNNELAQAISGAKDSITANVNSAKSDISKISRDDPDYESLVRTRKIQCHNANLKVVSDAASRVHPPNAYRPPVSTHELLTSGLPPIAPTASTPSAPSSPPPATNDPGGSTITPQTQTPTTPNAPSAPAPSAPAANDPGGSTATPLAQTPATQITPQQGANEPGRAPATNDPGIATAIPQAQQPAGAPVPNAPNPAGTPGVAPPPPTGTRTGGGGGGGGTSTTATSSGSGSPTSGLGGSPSSTGTPQSGNPAGQQTGAQQPGGPGKNPLQQGLQQFNQGLQNTAGQTSQPLASAQPATAQPTTPAPGAPTGAAGGASGTSAAPVGAASATGGGGSVGGPAAATPAAPAAPLGPAPTPSPAAPVAQPGPGGPAGPAVAAAGTNSQQAAAAAAPIPVSPARAERDALAAAAKAGLLQRKSAGNTDADIEIARRVSAALHAPPSIPAASYQFVWAVGVTSEGQILVANSYGIGYIPDGVKLPGQVTLVSADEAISPAERGRWVNFPFLAVQGWAQFHGKTLRAIIGTPEEVKPYKSSMHAEELAPDDIPADGTMQGRSRLQVIAPEAAARLEEWSDVTLYEALPPRPVQDAPPDAKQTIKLWVEAIKPLLRTTGTNGSVDHLTKLIAYADHMQSVELYKAYTAPHVEAQREAMSDWIYWQHVSSLCQDATNPVVGSVQA